MTVQVRLFAALAEKAGWSQRELDSAPTVERLWAGIVAESPELTSFKPLVALDRSYARWSDSLEGVSEVAFLPPIAGG